MSALIHRLDDFGDPTILAKCIEIAFCHPVTSNPSKKFLHPHSFCFDSFSTTNYDPVQLPSFHFAAALLQTPKIFHDTVSDPYSLLNKLDDLPVVLDTGASTSLLSVHFG
jgi:hypothetical protein